MDNQKTIQNHKIKLMQLVNFRFTSLRFFECEWKSKQSLVHIHHHKYPWGACQSTDFVNISYQLKKMKFTSQALNRSRCLCDISVFCRCFHLPSTVAVVVQRPAHGHKRTSLCCMIQIRTYPGRRSPFKFPGYSYAPIFIATNEPSIPWVYKMISWKFVWSTFWVVQVFYKMIWCFCKANMEKKGPIQHLM